MAAWEEWLELSLDYLQAVQLLRSLRPIANADDTSAGTSLITEEDKIYQGPGPWDQQAVQVRVSAHTFQEWLDNEPSTGIQRDCQLGRHDLVLFSGSDYLGISSHPLVRDAAAKASAKFGMGPKGSPLICGYMEQHRLLETALADLTKMEECLLCPTGFAANMGVLTALSSSIPRFVDNNRIAIFSDELNHASIIDGIRLAQRMGNVEVHVYRHNDMVHLQLLLSACEMKRKLVVTDSLFSMEGDFVQLDKLVELRKKCGFLLVLDDAHGILACGRSGGGVPESYGLESQVDIYVGTLSKAFGCQGGFISSSRKWKQFIQSTARAFIFSTSIPIPVVAAAQAALVVAREEKWRQQALWSRVRQLSELMGRKLPSYIVPIVIGDAARTLAASRDLLKAGYHVTAIRPPTVPEKSSRLRITLSASHSPAQIDGLYQALVPWLKAGEHPVWHPRL